MNNDAVWLQQNWSSMPLALQAKARALQRTEERFSPEAWYALMQEGRKEFNLPPIHPWSNFCILMMKSLSSGQEKQVAPAALLDSLGGDNGAS
jgi:hypothetical protein